MKKWRIIMYPLQCSHQSLLHSSLQKLCHWHRWPSRRQVISGDYRGWANSNDTDRKNNQSDLEAAENVTCIIAFNFIIPYTVFNLNVGIARKRGHVLQNGFKNIFLEPCKLLVVEEIDYRTISVISCAFKIGLLNSFLEKENNCKYRRKLLVQ